MKKIALYADGRFAHWILDNKDIPGLTIVDVDDQIAMDLSQNPQTKAYDSVLDASVAYVEPFVLANAQAAKKREMELERDNAILEPVSSFALGSSYTYNTDRDARQDLNDQITIGIGGYLTCADASGVKSRLAHSDSQLKAVAMDILTGIEAEYNWHQGKLTEINNATNQTEINLVEWA